jgi:hypothetical protein
MWNLEPGPGPAVEEPRSAAAARAPGMWNVEPGPRPPGVEERFAPLEAVPPGGASVVYRPYLMGRLRLHYADARRRLDQWRDAAVLAPLENDVADPWTAAERLVAAAPSLDERPVDGAAFAPLPPFASRAASWKTWRKSLESHAYRALPLVLFRCAAADLVSLPDETAGEFRARLSHRLHELRDAELEKLRDRYGAKVQRIEERIRRGEDRVERERSQHQEQKVHAAVSFGATLLGAVLGRRRVTATSLRRAGAAVRGVGRVGRERDDIDRAEADVGAARAELQRLEEELARETEQLQAMSDLDAANVEEITVAPRKSDIEAGEPVLVWVPWIETPGAAPRRAGLRADG